MNERADCPSSSSLDRLVQCSVSHNMGVLAHAMGQNKEEKSEDAAFGIRIHEALETGKAKNLQTDEERLAFSVMQRQLAMFVKGWLSQFPVVNVKELREHRMWLHNGAVPVFTGCADYILINGTHALILDYKSLWNKVAEPANNHQLRSLAVLLWLEHQELTEVTVQIISSHYNYVHYTMGVKELKMYLVFLTNVIRLVNQAGAPVPGDWCKYCRGLLVCPAVRKKASDYLKADEDMSLPVRFPAGESGAKILEEMVALSALIERVRDHYKTVITDNPTAIPGWTLQSRVFRKFRDIPNVFRMLEDKFKESVFNFIEISVAKSFSSLNPIEQAALEPYIEKTESSPGLVKRKTKDNGLSEK